MSSDRLNDYLNGINCFLSLGMYPNQPYKQEMSKNNAHFIIHENGNQINQWKFTMIFKGAVNLRIQGVNTERVIIIRKEVYSLKYQFIGDKKNLLFDSIDNLKRYLNEQYDYERLNLQNHQSDSIHPILHTIELPPQDQ